MIDNILAAKPEEIAALRECCVRYWTHAPRDNWNVIVTDERRPAFDALRDAGYIDLHGDVAALRIDRLHVCGDLIGPQATI